MALDRNAFIANYLDEVTEQLASIDASILALKDDPERDDALASLLRALHTIKGSSRMLKFKSMEALAHGLENVFKGIKEGRFGITRDIVRLVLLTGDAMRRATASITESQNDEVDTAPFLAVFERVAACEPYTLGTIASTEAASSVPTAAGSVPAASSVPSIASSVPIPASSDPVAGSVPSIPSSVPAASSVPTPKRQSEKQRETIRIDLGRIDGIVRILNNLIIKQFQFRKEKEIVARLEGALGIAVADKAGRGESVAEALRLARQLRKKLDEDLELMERNTFELQEDILSLRMLPLELILGNMGKMVEETSAVLGKDIRLGMEGTELHLDKFILEGLHDPIVHIVRNSVDHGIEKPADRIAKGKDPVGKLTISCSSESGHIVIRIKDDGRGLDYAKIRQRAMELFPSQANEIADMPESGLNTYLFMSGFSTKDQISDLSGRGVGLDIVRHNIEGIKGKISLSSIPDKGTEFVLSLPLSLATVDGFFIMSAGEKFLFPAAFVREVITVKSSEVMNLLNRRGFVLRNLVVPLYPLSVILGKGDDDPFERDKLYVVVVEAFGEIMGIMVDSIVQYTTLIYKPVPVNLSGLKALQGIVFDENFDIITILFVPELMNRCKRVRNIDTRRRYSAGRRENKRILVVDDSQTTREIEKSILELEDYQVSTAVDGIDGLDRLREQRFHLIVTDISMPRMDGLTFVENLRKLEGYAQTPVIVVSSEDDEVHRKSFREAGATSFIVKSEFERENLLERVKALIG